MAVLFQGALITVRRVRGKELRNLSALSRVFNCPAIAKA